MCFYIMGAMQTQTRHVYVVLNTVTGEFFDCPAHEARFWAHLNEFSVYLRGGGGTPLLPQEVR